MICGALNGLLNIRIFFKIPNSVKKRVFFNYPCVLPVAIGGGEHTKEMIVSSNKLSQPNHNSVGAFTSIHDCHTSQKWLVNNMLELSVENAASCGKRAIRNRNLIYTVFSYMYME